MKRYLAVLLTVLLALLPLCAAEELAAEELVSEEFAAEEIVVSEPDEMLPEEEPDALAKEAADEVIPEIAKADASVDRLMPELEISKGKTYKIDLYDSVRLVPASGDPVSFKSASKKIASVTEDGVLTANKAGSTKITVKLSGKKSFTVTIKVVDPLVPTSIRFEGPKTITVTRGDFYDLFYEIQPATAREAEVTFKSSSSKVVQVFEGGFLQAVGAGTATITVRTYNGKKATVKVKVVADGVDYEDNNPKYLNWRPSVGSSWTVIPKSVKIQNSNKITVEFWLLNGYGMKISYLKPFTVGLYYDGTRIAYKNSSKIKFSCGKSKSKVLKVTFTAKNIETDLTQIQLNQADRSLLKFEIGGYAWGRR